MNPDTLIFDYKFLDQLFKKAVENPRRRQNFDLRTTSDDTSQRMLNALFPGTEVPIHRHEDTDETVVCLCGRLWEVFYELVPSDDAEPQFREISRHLLCPSEEQYGIQVPAGVWHTIEVIDPSVIFEAKDGAYKG